MKVITKGHTYELDNFEESPENGQTLQFIHKVPVQEDSAELKTINNGTTNEEVLQVLINRMEYLQSKFPCIENENAIEHLGYALYWLNKRTEERKKRNVEGKQLA